MDAQPAPSIGALSSPRYNDDGEEVRL
jgi:hypothetical protein